MVHRTAVFEDLSSVSVKARSPPAILATSKLLVQRTPEARHPPRFRLDEITFQTARSVAAKTAFAQPISTYPFRI